jgi:hypothetical protein
VTDPLPEFGFLSQLVGINFPGYFLVAEGLDDPNVPGVLQITAWNAVSPCPPVSALAAVSIVNSPIFVPDPNAYLNAFFPDKGDPKPGLILTSKISAGNIAWAYPRPSFLKLPLTSASQSQGLAFFNLGLIAPGIAQTPALVTLLQQGASDLSPKFQTRVSLWRTGDLFNEQLPDGTPFTNRVVNGALVNLQGAIDVKVTTGIALS